MTLSGVYPADSINVQSFKGMVCILKFDFAIFEVFFDYSIVPTSRFAGGNLIPLDIDGCIDGGRPLEFGKGSFRLNLPLGRLLLSSRSGLNASKKIKGDKVSP